MSRWALGSALTLTVGLLILSTPASAAPADPAAFGQHVRHCAQVVGFDSGHNPGMHQGITGWGPGHVC